MFFRGAPLSPSCIALLLLLAHGFVHFGTFWNTHTRQWWFNAELKNLYRLLSTDSLLISYIVFAVHYWEFKLCFQGNTEGEHQIADSRRGLIRLFPLCPKMWSCFNEYPKTKLFTMVFNGSSALNKRFQDFSRIMKSPKNKVKDSSLIFYWPYP